jgi:EAL domain-containing protein (putative c-di-GMP-specific phosphodiesterase class I)
VGIEVTETALLVDAGRAHRVLRELRMLGLQIALDDFGTGYSSLLYLKELDIDVLKVSIDFITDLPTNATDKVIVHAVVEVARALGMTTVAEGIETEAQLRAVQAVGCDVGQGFLLGRPMSSTALRSRLLHDAGTRLERELVPA